MVDPPTMSYQLCAASIVKEHAIKRALSSGSIVSVNFQKAGLWSAQTLSFAFNHRNRKPMPAKAAVE